MTFCEEPNDEQREEWNGFEQAEAKAQAFSQAWLEHERSAHSSECEARRLAKTKGRSGPKSELFFRGHGRGVFGSFLREQRPSFQRGGPMPAKPSQPQLFVARGEGRFTGLKPSPDSPTAARPREVSAPPSRNS